MTLQIADVMKPDDVAKLLHVSGETIRKEIRSSRLRSVRVGRQYRITREQLEEYLCQTSQSDASGADSASTGATKGASEGAISLRHAPERKPSPRQSTSTGDTQRPQGA